MAKKKETKKEVALKNKLIKEIKATINKTGELSSAEMQLDCSPCLNSIGRNTVQLIENYGLHKVTAVTYVHDREEDEDYISYEDLPIDILEEILMDLENYTGNTP